MKIVKFYIDILLILKYFQLSKLFLTRETQETLNLRVRR